MFYDFPEIKHIDDVLPHIDDKSFVHAKKDGYQVINYVNMGNEAFPPVQSPGDAIRRECRGLVFDMQGNILNRRLHKFFNYGEREENLPDNVDFSQPHMILEKLDGSMISPCTINGEIRWISKMGITDTSLQAEAFVKKHPNYIDMAQHLLNSGFTPIFEWCSRQNRIVIDYPEDKLVLLAIRNNLYGVYTTWAQLVTIHKQFNIPLVKAFSYDAKNIVDIVKQQEDAEGVVIRFDNGHMLKVKSDWYIQLHKVKSFLEREKDAVQLILEGKLDDLLPVLSEDDRKNIERFANDLGNAVNDQASYIYAAMTCARLICETKKEYALSPAKEAFGPFISRFIFKYFEGKMPDFAIVKQEFIDLIIQKCGRNTTYDEFKSHFFGNLQYKIKVQSECEADIAFEEGSTPFFISENSSTNFNPSSFLNSSALFSCFLFNTLSV